MKKIRIWSVMLLIVSAAVFSVFKIYEQISRDNKPPEINCPEEELVLSVAADESELLKGVTAEDNRSGDVSDSLVVESLSGFTEDGVRIITYAAIDESGNVARCERKLRYEDYQKPKFTLSGPLRFPMGQTVSVLGQVGASSVLDGELSGNIKYTLENTIDVTDAGSYPIEFRVTDSGGNTVYLTTALEIYDPSEERIEVSLTEYLVYVETNTAFDPKDYYEEADQDGSLKIKSKVNTDEPGIYNVDYIVQGTGGYGKSRLVVIVGE